MATYAWPFDSNVTLDGSNNPVYDRAVSSDTLSAILRRFFSDGVFMSSADALQVTAVSGMTLSIAVGNAHIQGKCWGTDAAVSITITVADSQPRYDRVVLRRDNNSSVRTIYPVVIKGTPATNPVVPAQTRTSLIYDITLAYVYVGANVTSISQGNITDKRNSTECGAVVSINADINNALAGNQAVFETWLTSLQNTLSGDVAGNLLALINQRVSYSGDDIATDSQRAQARENTRTYMQTFTDPSQIGITLSTSTTLEQLAAALPDNSMLEFTPSSSTTSNMIPSSARYGSLILWRQSNTRTFATWYQGGTSSMWGCAMNYSSGWIVTDWHRLNTIALSGIASITVPNGQQNASLVINFSSTFSTAPMVTVVLATSFPGGKSVSLDGSVIPTTSSFKAVAGLSAVATADTAVTFRWYAEEII